MSDALLEQLSCAIDEAREEEGTLQRDVDSAKVRLAEARSRRRKLERLVRVYQGASGGATKALVRPHLARLLERGPLPDKELPPAITKELRDAGKPLSGFAFALDSLRSEFFDPEKNVWRLPNGRSR